jgi:hypothetical protein
MTIQIQDVGGIQSFVMEDPVAETSVTVTKKILAEETVFAHGDPIFNLCLSGTDRNGASHTYWGQVEFSDSLNADGKGYYTVTYTFTHVQRGTYTLTEKTSLGYSLSDAESLSENTAIEKQDGDITITIDNTKKSGSSGDDPYEAEITLINRKSTYDGYRHTDRAENVITLE